MKQHTRCFVKNCRSALRYFCIFYDRCFWYFKQLFILFILQLFVKQFTNQSYLNLIYHYEIQDRYSNLKFIVIGDSFFTFRSFFSLTLSEENLQGYNLNKFIKINVMFGKKLDKLSKFTKVNRKKRKKIEYDISRNSKTYFWKYVAIYYSI